MTILYCNTVSLLYMLSTVASCPPRVHYAADVLSSVANARGGCLNSQQQQTQSQTDEYNDSLLVDRIIACKIQVTAFSTTVDDSTSPSNGRYMARTDDNLWRCRKEDLQRNVHAIGRLEMCKA